nr:helix-turn-helix domain-containing protein [Streptomyces sp. S1D4-11]QIZ00183.1 PucR family transcriptional regulator [Streptomyces sp. S1D4-11]
MRSLKRYRNAEPGSSQEGLAGQPIDAGDVANTLRHRLTKIEQTVGVNFADPGIRLVLALQLKALAPA